MSRQEQKERQGTIFPPVLKGQLSLVKGMLAESVLEYMRSNPLRHPIRLHPRGADAKH